MARIKKIRRPGSPAGRVQRPNNWLKYGAEAGDPCEGGPNVRILQINSCGCSFTAPDTDCVVQCRYEARWECYTNTPNQFTWSNVNEVGTLIAGGGLADDFAVYETTAATDRVLDVNVTATDTVSGDSDSFSKDFTHTHSDDTVAPFFKGPDINNVLFPADTAISTFDFSQVFGGYITSYSLVGSWPAGLSIDNTGLLTGTPTGVAIYDSLTVEASGPGGTATTNPFTVTIYNATAESLTVSQVQAAVCSYNSGIGQTECVARGIYTATPVGWTTQPDSWVWSISSTSAGITAQIVAGQGTDTIDVDVTGSANGSITLRCEASNTNGELASDLTQFFTSHTDTVEDIVFIGPNIGDITMTVDTPFTLDTSTLFTGTITGYVLGGSWPGGFAINSSGVITGTTTSEAFYGNAFVRANNSVDFAISDIFDIYSVPAVPVFNGTIPLMVGTEGEPIAEYDASLHYQTGGSVSTYSLVNGQWLTIGASTGLINGTPPTGNDLIGAYVVGTNSQGSDNSNTFNVQVEAIISAPIFTGPVVIPAVQVDTAFSHDMSQYFSGDPVDSYALTNDGGQAWLSINTSTGELSGTTPATPVTVSGVIVTATNTGGSTPTVGFGFEVEAAAGYGQDLVFTLRTTTANETIAVGYVSGAGAWDCTVFWGDGTDSVLTGATPDISHEYATAGDHQVRVASGDAWRSFRYNNTGDKNTFISMDNLGHTGILRVSQGWWGCTNMTTFISGDCDISQLNSNGTYGFSSMFRALPQSVTYDFTGFDTSLMINMDATWYQSPGSDPDISMFNIGNITKLDNCFGGGGGLGNANYDKLLVAWAAQAPNIQTGVNFHAGSAKYTESAARLVLTDTYGWGIIDGGPL